MIAEHGRLAAEQQRHYSGYNQLDDVSFVHYALADIDRSDISLATHLVGIQWQIRCTSTP